MNQVGTDQYMEMRAMYMMWFYMYYMDAPKDQNNNPSLYPVYIIEIDRTEYTDICKKIMNKLLFSAIDNIKNDTANHCTLDQSMSDDSLSDDSVSDDLVSEDSMTNNSNNGSRLQTITEEDEEESQSNT